MSEPRVSFPSPDLHPLRLMVLSRLRLIGSGAWTTSRLSKPLSVDKLATGLQLWRLRIDKGGRVLFKVR